MNDLDKILAAQGVIAALLILNAAFLVHLAGRVRAYAQVTKKLWRVFVQLYGLQSDQQGGADVE